MENHDGQRPDWMRSLHKMGGGEEKRGRDGEGGREGGRDGRTDGGREGGREREERENKFCTVSAT